MRYLRRHLGFRWLGLLALAAQLVVSLGHVHAERDHEVTLAHADLFGEYHEVIARVALASESAGHHRDAPADSDGLDESCAVCATKAQAASLVLHAPAVVGLPRPPLTVPLLGQTDAFISDKPGLQFQARAPPSIA